MIIIICLLLFPAVFGAPKTTRENYAVVSTEVDELMEQSVIDEEWIDYMVTAPVAINLLGQVMVVASAVDVSFAKYSPGRVYKYIKYPESFRATLLQVGNGTF